MNPLLRTMRILSPRKLLADRRDIIIRKTPQMLGTVCELIGERIAFVGLDEVQHPEDAIAVGLVDDWVELCVGVAQNSAGTISKFGIEFGGTSEEGYAQVTTVYTGPEENVREALADSIGPQVVMLSKLEETFPDVLAQIDADIAEIMESIEIG